MGDEDAEAAEDAEGTGSNGGDVMLAVLAVLAVLVVMVDMLVMVLVAAEAAGEAADAVAIVDIVGLAAAALAGTRRRASNGVSATNADNCIESFNFSAGSRTASRVTTRPPDGTKTTLNFCSGSRIVDCVIPASATGLGSAAVAGGGAGGGAVGGTRGCTRGGTRPEVISGDCGRCSHHAKPPAKLATAKKIIPVGTTGHLRVARLTATLRRFCTLSTCGPAATFAKALATELANISAARRRSMSCNIRLTTLILPPHDAGPAP
ncbi:MAG: hypothetical protein H7232_17810 [Aeromicrobium sp.]|nr:hypothetical protein [Burkholderiales bacterium]